MPPNPKPTIDDARWATDGGAVVATILAGQKDTGWIKGQRPPEGILNRLFKEAYKWHQYLDTFVDNALTWTAQQVFSGLATFTLGIAVPLGSDDFVFLGKIETATGVYARIYGQRRSGASTAAATRGWAITYNARWNQGDTKWYSDDNAVDSAIFRVAGGDGILWQIKTAAASWLDSAWTTNRLSQDTSGNLQATGNVSATASVLAGATVEAGTVISAAEHYSETSALPGTARAKDTAAGDDLDLGWGIVRYDGMVWGMPRHRNVLSFTRSGAGVYVIDFNTVMSDPATGEVQVTLETGHVDTGAGTHYTIGADCADNGSGKVRVAVNTHKVDVQGGTIVADDWPFSVRIKAR